MVVNYSVSGLLFFLFSFYFFNKLSCARSTGIPWRLGEQHSASRPSVIPDGEVELISGGGSLWDSAITGDGVHLTHCWMHWYQLEMVSLGDTSTGTNWRWCARELRQEEEKKNKNRGMGKALCRRVVVSVQCRFIFIVLVVQAWCGCCQ